MEHNFQTAHFCSLFALSFSACQPPSHGDWQPLSHITIATAFTASGVLDLLENLRRSLESRQPAPHLLIIDSLGGVIGPIVGAAKGRGHEIMMHILRLVKAIAFEFDIAVLVRPESGREQQAERCAGQRRWVLSILIRDSCSLVSFFLCLFLLLGAAWLAGQTTNYTVSSSDRDRDAAMQRDPAQTTKMPALGQCSHRPI